MGGHVFVSYDRDDTDYVTELCEALSARQIAYWSDAQIPSAARWGAVIKERLDASVAVVVVMSPAAESSQWVGLEILRAKAKERPIYPLLLEGEVFFQLADIQHEDVSNGQLPKPSWFDDLDRLAGQAEVDEHEPVEADTPDDEARRVAEDEAEAAEEAALEQQARQEAEQAALRLAAQKAAAEEEARRRAAAEEEARRRAEEEEARRRAAAEEEARRRRRQRAILIGVAAAAAVVAAVVIIIAAFGGGGGGGGGGDGPETAEVTVPGDQIWTETDLDCDAGAALAITAEGTVFHNDQASTGPDGDPTVSSEFNVVPEVAHAALIGRIGEGDPFFVGSAISGTCQAAGPLSLGVNDRGPENNSGEFNATVEVQVAE